ncbi:Uncharacterised protein [Salmonella enterica subsp. arizonae]|uniref:Uncharacterized protein n=1 Tax=Salmonella enterica subsp. arizonae TaxID=59203 RepID=A0A379SWG8_SALER|nr:Uncharacterised protein [Salmonella enterica subsp. arizonae]
MSSQKLFTPTQSGRNHGDKPHIYGAFDAFTEY